MSSFIKNISNRKQIKTVIIYALLFYVSIWFAYSLLKIEREEGLKFLSGCSTFIFFLLLIQIHQKLFKIVLCFCALFALFYYSILQTYGRLNTNFIASIFYTNTHETWSYIKIIPLKVYINITILLLLLFFILKHDFKKVKHKYFTLGLVFYLILPPLIHFSFHTINSTKEEFGGESITHIPLFKIPILTFHLTVEVMEMNREIIAASKKKDDWEILNPNELQRKKNFVLIIGESLRRDVMQTYGFADDNSPFIKNSANIQFDNYLAMGPNTMPSLSRTIVRSDSFPDYSLSNNIVNLANKAGYKTHWISNQGFIGFYDSPISIIANASWNFYKNSGGEYTSAPEDSDILPVIKNTIHSDNEDKFIVIHMIGSHPSSCDRTHGKYTNFIYSKDFSCYLETVRMLDQFIEEIYHELQATNENFSLIYFSDHGLEIKENKNLAHGHKFKENYEVPLFIWGNEITEKQYIKAYRNGLGLLHLFCEMNTISTSNIQANYRFISEEEADYPVYRLLGSGKKIIDYRNLEKESILFETIK